ncbi:hypothetical protein FBU30_002878 [Linnemannia zychae]|nr:hypothetical protein FBU30_002878 [Linnemannia zychae]
MSNQQSPFLSPSFTSPIRFNTERNPISAYRGRNRRIYDNSNHNQQQITLQTYLASPLDLDKSEPKQYNLDKINANEPILPKTTSVRRNSLSALAHRIRSRSSSHSRSYSLKRVRSSPVSSDTKSVGITVDRGHTTPSACSSPTSPNDSLSSLFKYPNRKQQPEYVGAYAEVAKAQFLFMEKLREEQERRRITHNVDGLPLPPRRQTSLNHILGLDKPLLSR